MRPVVLNWQQTLCLHFLFFKDLSGTHRNSPLMQTGYQSVTQTPFFPVCYIFCTTVAILLSEFQHGTQAVNAIPKFWWTFLHFFPLIAQGKITIRFTLLGPAGSLPSTNKTPCRLHYGLALGTERVKNCSRGERKILKIQFSVGSTVYIKATSSTFF